MNRTRLFAAASAVLPARFPRPVNALQGFERVAVFARVGFGGAVRRRADLDLFGEDVLRVHDQRVLAFDHHGLQAAAVVEHAVAEEAQRFGQRHRFEL